VDNQIEFPDDTAAPAARYETHAIDARQAPAYPQEYRGPHRIANRNMHPGWNNGLGWFSLGLGIADLAAPSRMARLIGVQDSAGNRAALRFVGLREIASGVGILGSRDPTLAVWSRVAGDAIDLSCLAWSLASVNSRRALPTAAAFATIAGICAVDLRYGLQLGHPMRARTVRITKAITINKPADEIYQFWRDFSNLPRFMGNLRAVHTTGDQRSHWVAEGPGGRTFEWNAEVTEDRPNELIAWRSVEPSEVHTSGRVQFRPAPDGRGTEVIVDLEYQAPGGPLGRKLAQLMGKEPGQMVGGDLRRLKQVLETGEVIRSEATLESNYAPQRPAQHPERVPQRLAA
jgi:uncharacterized membrane protein